MRRQHQVAARLFAAMMLQRLAAHNEYFRRRALRRQLRRQMLWMMRYLTGAGHEQDRCCKKETYA
jgi:hypothetical protein